MQAGRNLLEYTASHPSYRCKNLTSQFSVLRNLGTIFPQDFLLTTFSKKEEEKEYSKA
jgi:hypothetical protein